MYETIDQFAQGHRDQSIRTETEYRQIKSRIAKAAMRRRVEAGECPGLAPVGYENVVVGDRRTVAIDPVLGPLIAEAFRLASQRKSSIRKILAELTPKGLVGKYGKPMGVSSLQVVLSNPFYAGLIRHRGKLSTGNHPPLISKCMFDRVHARNFQRRCK